MQEDPPEPHENQSQNMSAESAALDLRITAYHEAGHAVMALTLGRPIQKVTIEPGKSQSGDMRLGACEIKKGRSQPSKDWLEDEVLILLAGMAAEAQITDRYCRQGAALDLKAARRLLLQTRATSQRQLERLERRLLDKTEHLLGDEAHAKAIELIANELIEKKTLSGRAVRHFFHQAMQQSS